MIRATLVAVAFAALAACDAPPVPPPAPAVANCQGMDFAHLVGQPVAALKLPAGLSPRIVRPGMMVTMDYRPDRVTIQADARDVIRSAGCG